MALGPRSIRKPYLTRQEPPEIPQSPHHVPPQRRLGVLCRTLLVSAGSRIEKRVLGPMIDDLGGLVMGSLGPFTARYAGNDGFVGGARHFDA